MEKQEYKYNKLRGRIVEKYGSQKEFSKAFGISENAFSLKMNCKTEFSQSDMDKIATMLGISLDEYGEYFFA